MGTQQRHHVSSWLAPRFKLTWPERVAECERLLPPLLPVEQAQALLPQAQFAPDLDVSGNLGKCWLTFKASENSSFRPRGITPLLSFALKKDKVAARERELKAMYRNTPEFRFRVLDTAEWPGATSVYAHQSMGRHWLVAELGDFSLSVQMSEELPAEQLEQIARELLGEMDKPEIRAWAQH